MSIVLHQFSHSHFNEKARWALTLKGVAHDRRTYLPGPHVPAIRKLSRATTTPVLVAGNEVVPGSAAIVGWLEQRYPDPALYPADPKLRESALALEQDFDRTLGPAVRTALFSQVLNHGTFFCAIFADQHGRLARAGYRALFPVARPVVARANGVADPAGVKHAFTQVDEALAEIGQRVQRSGYLVGDSFTVADLTAAALLAPISRVRHTDMALPEPAPAPVRALLDRFAGHPAIRWVNAMYARHRA